ncbi:MAG: hypothetical protein EXR77_02920 [Myxococcales bacterium]|nr:hypothetical protein [Myxococcales bacterium]
MSPILKGLACWIVAAVAFGASNSAIAQAIGPGHEAEIESLVAPYTSGSALTYAAKLDGISIGAQHVDFVVSGPLGQATLRARLRPQSTTEQVAGPSWTFERLLEPMPPALAAALDVVQAQIIQADQGQWRQKLLGVAAAPPAQVGVQARQPVEFARWRLVEAAAMWALVIALLGWLARTAVSNRQGRTWGGTVAWTMAVCALLLLPFAQRHLLPQAMLHCNNHGIEDARLLTSANPLHHATLLARYGPAWFAPHWALTQVLGGTDQAMALAATLAGCAAAVVGFVAGWLWSGVRGGLAMLLLLAVMPLAVRVANSESSFAFGQLAVALAILSVAMIRVPATTEHQPAPKDRRSSLPGLGWGLLGPSLWLVGTGHSFGPGLAGALVIFFAPELLGPPSAGRRWWPTLAAASVAPLAFLPLVLSGDPNNRARIAAATWQEASPFKPLLHVLWWQPAWTTPVLVVAILVGVLAPTFGSESRNSRIFNGIMRLLGAWLLIGVTLFVGGSHSVALRYQGLLAPVAALLAMVGVQWLRCVTVVRPRWLRESIDVTPLAVVVGLFSPASDWQDVETASYASIADHLDAIPDGSWIVLPRREQTAGVEVVIDFPEFLGKRQGRTWHRIHIDELERLRAEGRGPQAGDPVFGWRGPHCQAFARVVGTPPQHDDGTGVLVHQRCVDLLRAFSGPVVVAGWMPAPVDQASELPKEFHQFLPGEIHWRLVAAR